MSFFSKVMPKFTKFFGMTYAKKGTYGVPEFARTEVNRRSGKLKGLMGYLHRVYKKYSASPASISGWQQPHTRHDGRNIDNHDTMVVVLQKKHFYTPATI